MFDVIKQNALDYMNVGWIGWDLLYNTDVIIFILVIIAVMWCVINKKLKPPVSKFDINKFSIGDLLKNSGGKLGKRWKKYHIPKTAKRKRYNKHEEKCREIFERIYHTPFESVRPDFLKNPSTGKNLELDGFCPYIVTRYGEGIAFEYDGVQHSKHTEVFHRQKGAFEYQCAKDSWKDKKCKDLGITLIRIPHFIVYDDLEEYIINILKKKEVYSDNIRISKYTKIAEQIKQSKSSEQHSYSRNISILEKGLYD
jgi:hypothetical protein